MPQTTPDAKDAASRGPSCPLVCGSVSLIRWGVRRFPHAARAAGLLVVALLLAAACNAANPLGIRWLPSSDGRVGLPRVFESRLPEIDAAQALALLQSGQAIFVDSRDRKDYQADHIPGAMNVPQRKWVELWPNMRSQLPRDRTLILYCYGGHCGLSTRQGKRLLQEGYENLLVLERGWEEWTEAGYPTQQQPQGKAT